MNTAWKWKSASALVSLLLAVWLVLPNFVEDRFDRSGRPTAASRWMHRLLPNSGLRMGLDLQGGIHMVLGVDMNRALINEADRHIRDLQELLPREGVVVAAVERDFDSSEIRIRLENAADFKKAEKFLLGRFRVNEHEAVLRLIRSDAREGTFRFDIDPQFGKDVERETIGQVLETLRNRLDEFGVAEPSIQAHGGDRVIVQLPGLDDPKRAEGILGRTAQLEFKLVDESMTAIELESLLKGVSGEIPGRASAAAITSRLMDRIPEGTQVLFKEDRDPTTRETMRTPYLIKAATLLTGDMLEDARIGTDEFNQPVVNLTFSLKGADIFERVTSENVDRRLAIILDDNVQSDPVIRERIGGGSARISFGSLRPRAELLNEAKDLALVLRAGALPAPVEILENRAVGPSLGRDSVERGMKAILLGLLVVMGFIGFYYRMAGIGANLALAVNLLFIMASLGFLRATLTLPGIAGIIIAIGMAVDANVIVFERIREELRSGKAVKAAVLGGYDRAHLTILDSNLTTIITALVLFQFGTGPIKGFAVTLIFGLVANYFTAMWFMRLGFEYFLQRFNPTRLSV